MLFFVPRSSDFDLLPFKYRVGEGVVEGVETITTPQLRPPAKIIV